MRIAFAGPSLYGATFSTEGIDLRPPAAQGDIFAACREGATVIGLIDGVFEASASVWHKEILFALSEGVVVLGGASMGALRAAECASFGMLPVGQVAAAYMDGEEDDAEVAITHLPPEFGAAPASEAMVDVRATAARLVQVGILTMGEGDHLVAVARQIYFKSRTVSAMLARAFPERTGLENAYEAHRDSVKTADALAVLARMREFPDHRQTPPQEWSLHTSAAWSGFVSNFAQT